MAEGKALSRDIQPWSTRFAALAAILSVALLAWISHQFQPNIIVYVLVMAAGSMLVPLALYKSGNLTSGTVLGITVLLHAIAIWGLPAFEDDYFRFIWDGWVTLNRGTPYGTPPSAYYDSPNVPAAMRPILDGVNNPDVPTIYGPVLQAVFALTFAVAGTDPMGLRIVFSVVNIALVALLLLRHPGRKVALYAWNPFAIAEIGLHMHPDGLLAGAIAGALLLMRRYPLASGMMFGAAAGIKLVALAAWPLLLRAKPRAMGIAVLSITVLYGIFFWQGAGVGLDATETFARQWYFNPLGYDLLRAVATPDVARLGAAALAGVGIVWLHSRAERNVEAVLVAAFGLILLFAPAVNAWYLLWLLPFAIDSGKVWPFAACAALALSYLTGINLQNGDIDPFAVHGAARLAELTILAAAVIWDFGRPERNPARKTAIMPARNIPNAATTIIIPALNEERSVGQVVTSLIGAGVPGLRSVIVVDNGSTDRTPEMARAAGAILVKEPRRGYGQACLTGLKHLPADTNVVLFADADGSDLASDAVDLVNQIVRGHADLAIGSRMLGLVEPGAMTWPQRFGNWLAPALIRIIWGTRYTDLGPLRAIRRDSLDMLAMQDRDFGWTVEMQVRAARIGLRTTELPAGYRRRIGISKISGTLSGVLKAGAKILYVVAREAFVGPPLGHSPQWQSSLAPERSQPPCVA